MMKLVGSAVHNGGVDWGGDGTRSSLIRPVKIAAGKEMNRLQSCMEVLRRLAKEPDDPDCVILAEQAINDYLKDEIDALKAALTRVGEAIDEEAGKRQDEDWSVMIGYVQSCLEKLPGANEDWEQN